MTKKLIEKKIEKIKRKIVQGYRPKKIILFGSFAQGKPTKDSDLDLFIIKESRKDPLQRCYEVRKMIEPILPLDLLVFTPQEVKKRLKLGDFFIKRIINKGRLLYEKK